MGERKEVNQETATLTPFGKLGVYINLGFNVGMIITMVVIYVFYAQASKVSITGAATGFKVLGIPFSVDIYAFLFIYIPAVSLLSIFFNVKLLKEQFHTQGLAIVFSVLSGSFIGAGVLIGGRARLTPLTILFPEEPVKPWLVSDQTQRFAPHTRQVPLRRDEELITAYQTLYFDGLVSKHELERVIQTIRNNQHHSFPPSF